MTRLYFAYGANTNLDAMAARCPAAEPLATVKLHGHRLVFRGVADVIPAPGHCVVGALWDITPECERSLDRFEGFPTLYDKAEFSVIWEGRKQKAMLYCMTAPRGFSKPWPGYEETLRGGYDDFGIDPEQLDEAIEHARQHARPDPKPYKPTFISHAKCSKRSKRAAREAARELMLPNWSA